MKLKFPSIAAIRAQLDSPEVMTAVAVFAVGWGMSTLLRLTGEARREYAIAQTDLASIGPVLQAAHTEYAGLQRRISERIADLSTYPPTQREHSQISAELCGCGTPEAHAAAGFKMDGQATPA